MSEKIITAEAVAGFREALFAKERSRHTVWRYVHDVGVFAGFLGGREASAEETSGFKKLLIERGYKPSSVNTILESLFAFFKFMGWEGCRTQRMVIQRDAYCPEERELTREDYGALLEASTGRDRLVIATICSTGIRVSELAFFTLEAVKKREIIVTCKRKTRRIMVPDEIGRELERFAEKNGIKSGAIFLGRRGKPLSRGRVWAIMKRAAICAKVRAAKAFPHNLRKLFARTFYEANHDVVKLADVLGHSSIETTRIYTKSSGAEHRRLVNALGLVPKIKNPPRQNRHGKGKKGKKIRKRY